MSASTGHRPHWPDPRPLQLVLAHAVGPAAILCWGSSKAMVNDPPLELIPKPCGMYSFVGLVTRPCGPLRCHRRTATTASIGHRRYRYCHRPLRSVSWVTLYARPQSFVDSSRAKGIDPQPSSSNAAPATFNRRPRPRPWKPNLPHKSSTRRRTDEKSARRGPCISKMQRS